MCWPACPHIHVYCRTGKKLEALKSESAGLSSKTKTQKKKEERLEQVLKQDSFELQKSKMTATVCVSLSTLSISLSLSRHKRRYFKAFTDSFIPFSPTVLCGSADSVHDN